MEANVMKFRRLDFTVNFTYYCECENVQIADACLSFKHQSQCSILQIFSKCKT